MRIDCDDFERSSRGGQPPQFVQGRRIDRMRCVSCSIQPALEIFVDALDENEDVKAVFTNAA